MKIKLIIKSKILNFYSAIIFFIVASVFSIMGFVISQYQEKHLLLAHVESYPDLINMLVEKNYEIVMTPSDETLDSLTEERFVKTISDIQAINGVSETALINLHGEIVAKSDLTPALKNIEKNPQFIKALSCNTGYEYLSHDGLIILNLYIPVKHGDSLTGVVYLSLSGSHLASIVYNSRLAIALVVTLCGISLYFIFLYIFYCLPGIYKKLRQEGSDTNFDFDHQSELMTLESARHQEMAPAYPVSQNNEK